MKITVGQHIPIYEVVENEQEENCEVGVSYPAHGRHHDCICLVNFKEHTQFYMYDYEIKLTHSFIVKSIK